MRFYWASLYAVLILAIPWFIFSYPDKAMNILTSIEDASRQFAAVILSHNPKTVADIRSRYAAAGTSNSQKKVRILIVPGHEPNFGGAEFGSVKEREMTVELGQDLQQFLAGNDHYQVYTTRTDDAWSSTFDSYFKTNWNTIKEWTQASEDEMSKLVSMGTMKKTESPVIHNNAPTDVALRLYGITKWANENDIDITIHIHFNDYPGHGGRVGTHSGFAIYVPENQYANSPTTAAVAKAVFDRIAKYNPVSDLPGESTGIVEEPDLIAIGANNTANAASMLIEYGYLYEPQFVDPTLRTKAIRDLAFQTYLGLQDFFGASSVVNVASAYDTLLIPRAWGSISAKTASSSDVYALQTALLVDGDYPPTSKSKNDCPRTGSFGPCTLEALQSFQTKYGITGEKGIVGPKTQSVLNSKFGSQQVI